MSVHRARGAERTAHPVRPSRSDAGELIWLAAWAGALGGLIVLLGRAPALISWSELAAPSAPLAGWWPHAWATVSSQDPLLLVFAAGRVLVIVLAWYQLGLVVLGAVARLARLRRVLATVELLTLPPLRRLVWGAVGISMSVGMMPLPAAALPARPAASATVSGVPVPPGVGGPDTLAPAGSSQRPPTAEPDTRPRLPAPPAPPGLTGPGGLPARPVTASETPDSDRPSARPAGAARPAAAAGDPEASEPDAATAPRPPRTSRAESWTVRPGDHLWAIAEATVRSARPGAGLDTVADYWLGLIEANRQRLPDPGNPDLILPGMRMRLPPLNAASSS